LLKIDKRFVPNELQMFGYCVSYIQRKTRVDGGTHTYIHTYITLGACTVVRAAIIEIQQSVLKIDKLSVPQPDDQWIKNVWVLRFLHPTKDKR
jgi:hypothetical protein